MLTIYVIIICVILLLSAVFHKYKSDIFKQLARKEHPLKFLYPAAARVYDLAKGIFRLRPSKTSLLMKQLCVKENIDTDMYVFTVRKIASTIGIILAACAAGVLLCINDQSGQTVSNLARSPYGTGNTVYQLDVDYEGNKESIDISIEAARRTHDEILELFDKSYPAVINEMLGENVSAGHVSSPVHLISSYGDIKLYWEIEDTSLLSYNGEITEDIEEGADVPLQLFVTFTLDDVSEVFSVPLVLSAPSLTETERLAIRIAEEIRNSNSEYSSTVDLPESVDGVAVSFTRPRSFDPKALLIITIIAAGCVFFLFNKRLEDAVKKRNEQMCIDFTEIVFKLSLLYEAGLSIFRAWERIVTEHEESLSGKGRTEDRYAYREMKLTLEQIRNGASEAESYGQFGRRCGLHQYIKLGNILEQNLTKGARGMKALLRQEAQDAFEERKRSARRKGEEASTKLLIPMIMMLIVVMMIVAVPALMSFSF